MSQIRRRHIGNKTGDGIILPTGYTKVDYVTNIYMKSIFFNNIGTNFEVFIDCAPHFTPLNDYGCIIGQNVSLQLGYNASGKASVGNSTSAKTFFEDKKRCEVYGCFSGTYANTKYFVDGIDTGLHRACGSSREDICGNGARGGANPCVLDIYSIRIIKDGVDIYHYIPCIRDSDNAKGLYDIVNNEFISNAFN